MRRHLDGRRAVVARRGNVQKYNLVRTFAVVGAGQLHRVARIAQAHKVDALDHAAVFRADGVDRLVPRLVSMGYSSPRAAASAWASVKLPS